MDKDFKAEGYVQENIAAVVMLLVGAGVAVLILIFVGVLAGQTYEMTEDKITDITDANIEADVKDAISAGFEALKTSGEYLPLIILAIVIFIILGLVMGMFGGFAGGGRQYGGAL